MFPTHSYDLLRLRLEEASRQAERTARHAHDLQRARQDRKGRRKVGQA